MASGGGIVALDDLKREIENLNQYSEFKYHVYQLARNKNINHYNDRKIKIYFENNGSYINEKRLIELITIYEHKFGSIDSTSKYMGYEHNEIYSIAVQYSMLRRSQRAPISNKYWAN